VKKKKKTAEEAPAVEQQGTEKALEAAPEKVVPAPEGQAAELPQKKKQKEKPCDPAKEECPQD
jgi:hypothetical protein